MQNDYFMDATQFNRTGSDSTKYVLFDDISIYALSIRGGDGGNYFRIDGTPVPDPTLGTQIGIYTGDNDDFVTVRGTRGPASLDLGLGVYQSVSLGDDDAPLDDIRGDFSVTGSGFIDAFISNEAATASQYVNIDQSVFFRQTLERYTYVDKEVQYLNRIQFPSFHELQLQYTGGQGGDTVYVSAVDASASVAAYGAAGVRDTFAVGFGADMNRILGRVYLSGQAADYDFSYYYDYLNANPQSYQFTEHPLEAQALVAERSGAAPVTFKDLNQVILYTPLVGGSDVSVTGLPAQTFLNMAVGADVVRLGASNFLVAPLGVDSPLGADALGGTLASIKGPVSIGGYGTPGGTPVDVTLIVDNSGNNDLTPRRVELYTSPGTHLVGLAPAPIHWNVGPGSSVSIRGGAADETFTLRNTDFVGSISIDGGGGINTLDYSASTPAMPGLASWWGGENNAQDSIGSRHGTPFGSTTFAPGKVGQALSFDGDGDHVRVQNAVVLEPTTVSVEAWVNSTTLTAYGEYNYILAKGAAEFRGASYALTTSLNQEGGGLWFYVGNGSAFAYSPDPGPGIWDGNWHHVVGTYDGSFVRLYVDGVEVGNGNRLDNVLGYGLPTSNDLYIGTYGGIPGYSFDGLIDEPAVFNRALTSEEVRKLYAAGPAGKSVLATGVTVNLHTNDASGLEGGIASIHNVIGSAGNDVLLGNGGNVLDGRAGRDLLIAGNASGTLLGGLGEDLLIAGMTKYDTDPAALAEILAEWARTDIDYPTRIADLTTDNSAAVPKLMAGLTVFSNGGGNALTGGTDALDLFFAALDTDVLDQLGEEEAFVRI
jgi:hypothetical protein